MHCLRPLPCPSFLAKQGALRSKCPPEEAARDFERNGCAPCIPSLCHSLWQPPLRCSRLDLAASISHLTEARACFENLWHFLLLLSFTCFSNLLDFRSSFESSCSVVLLLFGCASLGLRRSSLEIDLLQHVPSMPITASISSHLALVSSESRGTAESKCNGTSCDKRKAHGIRGLRLRCQLSKELPRAEPPGSPSC